MSKKKSEAPLASADALLNDLLLIVKDLHDRHPFALAAAVDWLRQEWRGDSSMLDESGWLGHAKRWIGARALLLHRDAINNAGYAAINAAVTS